MCMVEQCFGIVACEFKCEADDGCLNEKKICDNYPDCSDGQDEDGCRKMLL